jgi:hypothetical protein
MTVLKELIIMTVQMLRVCPNMSILLIIIILLAGISGISVLSQQAYAGGARNNYPTDATDDEADCWVEGFDDGFAGKCDKDRGSECEKIGHDNYDYLWNIGCRDAGFHPRECEDIRDYHIIFLAIITVLVVTISNTQVQAQTNITAIIEINEQSILDHNGSNVNDAWFTIDGQRYDNGSYYDMGDWVYSSLRHPITS